MPIILCVCSGLYYFSIHTIKLYWIFFSEPQHITNAHVVCCPLSLQAGFCCWCLPFFFRTFVSSSALTVLFSGSSLFRVLSWLVPTIHVIHRLFPLLGHKLHYCLRILSCSVLSSVQGGMQEHAVREKSHWFVQGFFND